MPLLAIAGGTSATLGRAIVTSLLSHPASSSSSTSESKWTVLILSRTTRPPAWLLALSASEQERVHIRAVDYLSVPSLATALEGVHTLLSLLFSPDGGQATREINLLRAAVEARVKRFAPTAWGLPGLYWDDPKSGEGVLAGLNAGVWEACLEAQRAKGIECARFNLGVFMNYLAWGIFDKGDCARRWTEDELRVRGGYAEGADDALEGVGEPGEMGDGSGGMLVSLRHGLAELPVRDDGLWPRVTMTTVRDVGRFVTATLELQRWEGDMSIVGDTVELGELVVVAEEITGSKIQVRKLRREELVKRWEEIRDQEERFVEALWLQFKILYCDDQEGKGWLRPVVNDLCPGVKPVRIRQYLERLWQQSGTKSVRDSEPSPDKN